jgi:membrane protein DedA with SNARE-associated domain
MTHTLAVEGPLAAYAGLFWLLALSWAGLPTAGQVALITAGALAGKGKLDLGWVLVVGTLGSALGGLVAFVLGRWGGRPLWTAHGPMYARRLRALESGEKLFARYKALAVFVVPMWLAGIANMRWAAFVFWDGLVALTWTLICALGGYLVGPAFVRLFQSAQTPMLIAVGVVVVAIVVYTRFVRRRSGEPGPAD